MDQQQAKFEGWALVELMGHQKEIGYVTTEYFGVAAMLRIDTPELAEREYELERPEWVDGGTRAKGTKVRRPGRAAKSRLVSPGSLYAINPCTEAAALKQLERSFSPELILVDVPKPKALVEGEYPNTDEELTICAACLAGDCGNCTNSEEEEREDWDCECLHPPR